MDVFDLRERLVGTYRDYATSFVPLRDRRLDRYVDEALESGWLWPDPRVGLNPSFESGGPVEGLVSEGLLHPLASDVFRSGKSGGDSRGRGMRLYRHQVAGIGSAAAGRNYVLTTGTGSGKSLAYIIPIVDHVLRTGSGRGVQAVVVYPMNALVNSQLDELGKYLDHGPWDRRPVTFERYTGQEDQEARERILSDPPDVLLTNYVMLELILTRYTDHRLVSSLGSLRFLVLDELHTYRGRQGADVSLLVRRLREVSGVSDLVCVGTSATLSTEGSLEDRQAALAAVGSRLFGAAVDPSDVISETLERSTLERSVAGGRVDATLAGVVERCDPPSGYEEFVADPLASWLESTFGVRFEGGRLVRAIPRPVEGKGGAAADLSAVTGLAESLCAEAIRSYLLAGSRIPKPGGGSVFPFRLHQFVSRGDTVYASPESPAVRYLSLDGQRFVPGSDRRRVLLPLAFCRECGQDYYTVSRPSPSDAGGELARRDLSDRTPGDGLEAGFVYLSDARPWPDDPDDQLRRLPRDWIERGRVSKSKVDKVPCPLMISGDGSIGAPAGTQAWWIPAPFRFCLACDMSYTSPRGSDFARLATLGSGGRASATTVMSVAAVRHLKADPTLGAEAQKLLSFSDNRQDASLQAGHFNDFVEVTMLRSALSRAVAGSGSGVPHDQLPRRVFDMLGLSEGAYAQTTGLRGRAKQNTERAMLDVLSYRLYRDLRRGWRVTQPNLEQVGLLRIGYESLAELAADEGIWEGCHRALAGCSPTRRERVIGVLLDWMRSQLAITVNVLDPYHQESLKLRAGQWLKGSWALENEDLEPGREVLTRPKRPTDRYEWRHVTGRGTFGLFLRREDALGSGALRLADRDEIIGDIFEGMETYGLVAQVGDGDDRARRWQIRAGALIWMGGDGTRHRDRLRTSAGTEPGEPNRYFSDLYRNVGAGLAGMEAREHTAQVPADVREEREGRFRSGELPVLFCSPTMELGVDISELNVVNMRNVPPTPANYAQRSGRAGRGGQPALVFTYCASANSHDQYFFRQQELMIAGQVEAPRIDLTNEALLRAHVHAVWLAESGLDLGQSMSDILDMADDDPRSRPRLKKRVQDCLDDPRIRARARVRAERVLEDLVPGLGGQSWWSQAWLDNTLGSIPMRFEKALERWMTLYTAAVSQVYEQTRISLSQARSARDRRDAKRLRAEADRQLDVLRAKADSRGQSDFYTYRYFASEGFLPGYSFPRLPLSAFIPGRRIRRWGDQGGDYLQRPRFLAVSEFGPRAHIYHEGSRYRIDKVIMSRGVDEDPVDDDGSPTEHAKRCDECGYMHPFSNPPGPDNCDNCSAVLAPKVWSDKLLRMRNVSTVRRERITSDEERRQRAGFEIISGLRFSDRGEGGRSLVQTSLRSKASGDALLELTYGDTATIWRVNLGWRRRTEGRDGFLLNVETGRWETQHGSTTDPDPDAATTERVVPYVKDSRNVLLVEPTEHWPEETLASLAATLNEDSGDDDQKRDARRRMNASLAAALKAAIQVVFHLEPSELAVEPLPNQNDRRRLLFYESTEGGAGALRQLIDNTEKWQQVARAALEICHAGDDPEGGCGGACYRCLLTYQNQWDHELLDRTHVIPFLNWMLAAELGTPVHQQQLEATTSLEQDFIAYLTAGGYRLPDTSQRYFEAARTRPDFIYHDACVAVYVDGPDHDYPDRAARDRDQEQNLLSLGLRAIRFGYRDDWDRIIGENPDVFGTGRRKQGR